VTRARGMEVAGAVDSYLVGEDIGRVCFPLSFTNLVIIWCLYSMKLLLFFILLLIFFSFFKAGVWHGRASRNSHNEWSHHGIRFHISGNILNRPLSLSRSLSLWVNKLTLYCILVVKSNRSCHWFHWSFDSIWKCETGKSPPIHILI